MFSAKNRKAPALRQRVDVDRSGVWISAMHIIDRRSDRAMVIPKSQWPQYEKYSDLISETLINVPRRVVRTVVPVDVDPDIKKFGIGDAR